MLDYLKLNDFQQVSIEGNTLTLEELRYILDTGRAVGGKSIQEHNEVLGLELAMQYVKLMTRMKDIGIQQILGIHRRVMGHVDPLTSGTFRDQQVSLKTQTFIHVLFTVKTV